MTRETEIEREGGEIVDVRELDERTGEAQLRQILVQRDTFQAAEKSGEIGGRGTHGAADLGQPQAV